MKSIWKSMLVIFATLWSSASRAQLSLYESETRYEDPFAMTPMECQPCVQFYRVVRPLFPLINHIVIGAQTQLQCGAEIEVRELVYGASKGNEDIEHFKNELKMKTRNVQPLGSACDEKARMAIEKAVRISQRWQIDLQNQFSFAAQMVMTPLTGRICNNAAEEVRLAIEMDLTP